MFIITWCKVSFLEIRANNTSQLLKVTIVIIIHYQSKVWSHFLHLKKKICERSILFLRLHDKKCSKNSNIE